MSKRSRRRTLPPPMDVTIESLSHEGRGICHHNGKIVFVFAALPGEKVRIQITKTSKKFDEAKVIEVLEPSAKRIQPLCPHFSVCGGCSMQHIDDQTQIELKTQSVREMLDHAGLKPETFLPPLQYQPWGYRRKARLGVKFVRKKDRLLIGFRERDKPYLADMQSCEILDPRVGKRLTDLMALISGLEARETIAQIEVAADDDHCVLVLRHLEPLSSGDRQQLLQFARQSDFWLQLQPKGPDTTHPLYPEQQQLYLNPLPDNGLKIRFQPSDFTQVNNNINRKMVVQALKLLDLKPGERVLDLFCGLGNFTLPMALNCESVIGVEGDEAMVNRARENARTEGVENTEYFSADLMQDCSDRRWMKQRYDKILLDPPRSGAQMIAENIERLGAQRIVYVSCQPSTLARDAQIICAKGYRLTHFGLMDMFPQTAHVESMAVFEKR